MTSVLDADLQRAWSAFREEYKTFCDAANSLYRAFLSLAERVTVSPGPANHIIYLLSLGCLQEFNEILLLAGHTCGIGSAKILRSFYERVVTLAYLADHPEEGQAFIEYSDIHWYKLIMEQRKAEGKTGLGEDEESARIVAKYNAIRPRFIQTDCKKCGTKRLQSSWTRKAIPELAEKVSEDIRRGYFRAFLVPTFYIHTTFFGAANYFEPSKGLGPTRVQVNMDNEKEQIETSLSMSHALLLQVAYVFNNHFKLGHEAELDKHYLSFVSCWKTPSI